MFSQSFKKILVISLALFAVSAQARQTDLRPKKLSCYSINSFGRSTYELGASGLVQADIISTMGMYKLEFTLVSTAQAAKNEAYVSYVRLTSKTQDLVFAFTADLPQSEEKEIYGTVFVPYHPAYPVSKEESVVPVATISCKALFE